MFAAQSVSSVECPAASVYASTSSTWPLDLWSGSPCSPTLYESGQPCTRIKDRSLVCKHTWWFWRAHWIRPGQIRLYGLATSTVHAIHITHQTDAAHTHTHAYTFNIWILCAQNGCLSVSSASTERSLPNRPRFVLGTGLLGYDTSRGTERKRTQGKTGRQFLDDRKRKGKKKKSGGEMACVVLQPQ